MLHVFEPVAICDQFGPFFARESEHEIRRESASVSFHLLVEALGRHSLQTGENNVEHDALVADDEDAVLDSGRRRLWERVCDRLFIFQLLLHTPCRGKHGAMENRFKIRGACASPAAKRSTCCVSVHAYVGAQKKTGQRLTNSDCWLQRLPARTSRDTGEDSRIWMTPSLNRPFRYSQEDAPDRSCPQGRGF